MGWPEDRLDIKVELSPVTGEWVDLTAAGDVYGHDRADIQITRGRSNLASQLEPGRCTLELNNRSGKYSPRNPRSPYYGQIGRNTPLRVSVPGTESYLQLDADPANYATTPYTAAMDPVGVVDVRAEATVDWQDPIASQTLIGRWDPETDQRCWVMRIYQGQLAFSVSSDGTWATQYGWGWPLPLTLPKRAAVRAVFDPNASTLAFYWAQSLDGPWTEILAPTAVSGGSMFPGATSGLTIGPHDAEATPFRAPFAGRGHRFEVHQGGVLVAAPDFRTLPAQTTQFTDEAGLPWTVAGQARVSDRYYRFVGEVSEWPQKWQAGGADAWTPIEAAGPLRRYGQGAKALQSTLRRRIPSASPLAYWPMEDGRDATQGFSPTPGVTPLTVHDLNWASDSSLAGSDALPTLSKDSWIRAQVPAADRDGWHVELVYKLDKLPGSEETMLIVDLGGGAPAAYAKVRVSTAAIKIELYDSDGQLIAWFPFENAAALADFTGAWNRLQVYSALNNGTLYVQAAWRDVVANNWWYTSTSLAATRAGTVTRVRSYGSDGLAGMALGHLAVFDVGGTWTADLTYPNVTVYEDADDGYAGETAAHRLRRLAQEENLLLSVVDGPGESTSLGPQKIATVLDNVRDVVAADGGLLVEQLETLGLRYEQRAVLYNQAPALVLDYTVTGEVEQPFEPVDDDTELANDITVTRDGGSSARATLTEGPLSVAPPPAGVGVYDEAVTLSLATDDQPPQIAAWRLHLGTVDEARYPRLTINLRTAPQLIDQVLSLDIGGIIRVDNLPPFLPPGPLLLRVEGYTETLNAFEWMITFNCSPASPWAVGVVGDGVLGRADTDGTVLDAPVAADTTTLPVRATAGPDWVTDPSEFPFDLRLGGEVVTVQACTEAEATPMRAGADSATATASTAVAPSVDATQAGDLLVCAWVSWDFPDDPYTPPASMTRQADTTGQWSVLTDATETAASAGPLGTRTATRSPLSAWAAVSVLAAGTPVIEEHLADIATDTAQTHSPGPVTLTTATGTQAGWWLVALHAWDNAGAFSGGPPEGEGWVELAMSGYGGSSRPLIGAWAKTADGGAETVVFPQGDSDDNHARLYVISGVTDLTAQLMTVTRAVNGVVKNQIAGTDVRLAQPSIVAL